nr:sulfotransferase [uncultured Sphingomonas sp.]
MHQRLLPSFIIIGAAKAATTWIAHQLRSRDDVFLPGPEPHYFSRAYDRGAAWYESLFAAARPGQLIGEKSADYLASPEAPARAAALLPRAKLVAQLRNPVERAYSDYCMLYRRGQVGPDIDRYLDRHLTRTPRFLDDGLYARHLARWLDRYPAEALKVILYDDIRGAPEQVLGEVCTLLSIPSVPVDRAQVRERKNDSEAPLVPMALRRLPSPVKALVAPLRGNRLFENLRNTIARPVRYPPLSDALREKLTDFYLDDVEVLSHLVGRDLSAWMPARLSV